MNDDLKTFRDALAGRAPTNPKAASFADVLLNHGECQVGLASGEVHSIHLGDHGRVDDAHILYRDRTGQNVWLFWDQVERLDFHLGYKE